MAKSAQKKEDNTEGNGQLKGQPLFFVEPHAVDKERHAKAGLNGKTTMFFAKDTNSIPINIVEFAEAARNYPIVLSMEEDPMPIAIAGLRQRNYFVSDDGVWDELAYAPAYIRKYPFALIEWAEKKQYILCVDEKSEHYAEKNPEMPFFDDSGEPTEVCKKAMEFCSQFQQQYRMTLEFTRELKAKGVLTSKQVELTLPSGEKINMGGFQLIDEKKFHELPDEVFLDWRKKGYTVLATLIFTSQVNWRYLTMHEGRLLEQSKKKK